MHDNNYNSWGSIPRVSQRVVSIIDREKIFPEALEPGDTYLPFGNGRSYGDVCLNDGGQILHCRALNKILAFDRGSGVIKAEAGVLFSEILALIVPQGWFLPVTPGTQFVTLGGAIANDVHGKNHHVAGSFGCHVNQFELYRSNGDSLVCSESENQALFQATIGGLGLTGVIVWAEVQLRKIDTAYILQESICFENLDEYFEIAEASAAEYEYTVAWIDCVARGKKLGRGVFLRGRHAEAESVRDVRSIGLPRTIKFPFSPRFSLVNNAFLSVFNSSYFWGNKVKQGASLVHYQKYFYPLDSILKWNRIYGQRGFYQHQSVIPNQYAMDAIKEQLDLISTAKTGSFLAVLKSMGDAPSKGLMSFSRPGVTLALDFPNRGDCTTTLLGNLEAVTRNARGAINPSKDATMRSETLHVGFSRVAQFEKSVDTAASSSFWRRVMSDGT